MDRKGKFLVTGASGFLGRSLIQKLFLQEGMQIVGLVRNPKTAKESLPQGIELIQGDITDRNKLPSFPSDVDAVIHAAGILGKFLAKDSDYRLVNATGTENVLCASESAGIRNLLLVSSAGVLGPIKNPPADESMSRSPSNGYERSKAEAEEITERFHREGRIRATIVRPEFIYGPGDLHLLGFFRAIRDRRFFLIGSGDSLLHPTYVEDVSQAIWAAITHGGFNGSAYLVTGPRYVTVRELYQITTSALGVPMRRIRLPKLAAYGAAGLMEIAGRAIGKDMPLTFSKVRFFTENRAFKSDRAKTVFNYVPRFSVEEGVAETVKWYRDRGLL
jgi:nucleoside-diphosphate-sugar epimerase